MPASRRAGFTLIETVAAIVILSVAVPHMLWAVAEAHIQRVDAMLASRARWLVTAKLEDVIADRHSESGNRGYDYLVTGNYPAEATGSISGYEQFGRTVAFDEVDPTDLVTSQADSGYMKVTVNVGWTDGGGDSQTLSIVTILTEY